LLIGDSITHNLDLPPFKPVWDQFFAPRRALNLSYSGARTENILWNLQNSELDNQSPKVAVLLIGTNNVSTTAHAQANTPAQVAAGIRAICLRIRSKSPESRIIVMGVLPRGAKADAPYRVRIAELNKLLPDLGRVPGITFPDIGDKFLQPSGELPRSLMGDFCHPSEGGYAIWAAALEPLLADDRL